MCDNDLRQAISALADYARALASGDFSAELPERGVLADESLKGLYESLLKIREQMAAVREESARTGRYAALIENDNELLVELLSRRNEWLLVVDTDSKEILYCNKRRNGKDGTDAVCETCKKRLSFQSELLEWKDAEYGDPDQYNVWEMEGEGETFYRITSFPVEWKDKNSHVHIVVDITDEKRMAHALTSKAYRDPGTGIRNRLFFEEYMDGILRERRDATLCYLDLDGLKYVNDTFGHVEGDIYIQNFVELIRSNFRNDDTFARTGGDEFCLVLTGRIKDLIDRKMAEILESFQAVDNGDYQCSFSYGIVEVEGKDNEWTLDEILQEADAAMYDCKRRNKEKYPALVR
ncbi:MAG: diguanylate cyclase [Lachnospiraceae bacterium]|nr:diguanylate cyclase [Lachnospiraceae bacterium]